MYFSYSFKKFQQKFTPRFFLFSSNFLAIDCCEKDETIHIDNKERKKLCIKTKVPLFLFFLNFF